MTEPNPFRCLTCRSSPLRVEPDAHACGRCGTRYPIRHGVPLFLRDVKVVPSGRQLSRAMASEICRIASLPDDEATAATLAEIFAHDYELPDLTLTAENNYFFNRVPLPEHVKRAPVHAARPDAAVNQGVRYAVEGHLIADFLPCGRELTRNVRLRNTGESVISSKTVVPVYLTYRWRDPRGELVEREGLRTPLPIDLLPGRAISLPTLIRTPRSPGSYVLELALCHDAAGWLGEDAFTVGVEVVRLPEQNAPAHWEKIDKPQETYSYVDDHYEARDLLFQEIARRRTGPLRVLEVGGCCNPLTRGLPAEIYNVDIDVQTLQVGNLLPRAEGERLHFVCADACDLPFVDHCFDCVALFSTLHHFADPGLVLKKLKRLLRPGGFLALLCEPVGSYRDGQVAAEFARELEQGINEQIFTPEEYHLLFQRAGLYTSKAVVDRGSFKAFLHAQGAPPRPAAGRPTLWSRVGRRLRVRSA